MLLLVDAVVDLGCGLISHIRRSWFRGNQDALIMDTLASDWLDAIIERLVVFVCCLVLLSRCVTRVHWQVKRVFKLLSVPVRVVIEVDACDSFVVATRAVMIIVVRSSPTTSASSRELSDWNVSTSNYAVTRLLLSQVDWEVVEIATSCIHVCWSDTALRNACNCIP